MQAARESGTVHAGRGRTARVTSCVLALALLALSPSLVVHRPADPVARGAAMPAPGAAPEATARPVCVYVSSYHRGYSWSDRLEDALREGIDGACRLVRMDLDAKRERDPLVIERAARHAFDVIGTLGAAVVIVADDHAAKYLVVPYLKGGDVPVVFAGLNWTVEEYGFPAPGVTGMVEVAPIVPMIRRATDLVPGAATAAYVGASTLTEAKNYERIRDAAARLGVRLDSLYGDDMTTWMQAFRTAQDYDFVVVGSSAGLVDWDESKAVAHALAVTRRPSFTNHDWMMPVTAMGYTKVPEEQGEWAAASVLAILGGMSPGSIPLVTNRKWDTWVNEALLAASGTRLPPAIANAAKRTGAGS